MDCHADVVNYLRKCKTKYTILEPDNFLPIVKNEEKMISLIFDALINQKVLVINCDKFTCEP